MNRILTICKPTYNRKNVIIPDVTSYMSINDDRFVVKINDNASTDGTAEGLLELKKEFPDRIILNSFPENRGGVRNGNEALRNVETPYILYLLDKDTIDCDLLPKFIDILEQHKPYFGYVDITCENGCTIKQYEAGFDACTNVGFRNGHPSGFFFKSELLYKEMAKDYFIKTNDVFDFALDMIQGSLGLQYPATVIEMPLVIDARKREDNTNSGKTYSYNEENIYFGYKARAKAYNYFLDALLEHRNYEGALKAIEYITSKYCIVVSIGMQTFYKDEATCYHYNVPMRDIKYNEMHKNVRNLLCIFQERTRGVLKRSQIYKCYMLSYIKFQVYYIVKKLLKKL